MLLGLVKVKDVKSSALLGFNHILQENVEDGRGGYKGLVRVLAFTKWRVTMCVRLDADMAFDSSVPK